MRRAPKADLRRFVAEERDGVRWLRHDPEGRAPGRGAYVCASEECFERAIARRAFGRALRIAGAQLQVDRETVAGSAG